nr:RDD family protein [Thioalkalivibrio versutus]
MDVFCTQCGAQAAEGARYCGKCGATLASAELSATNEQAVSSARHTGGARVPDPGVSDATDLRYAGFWYRVLAWVIDYVLSLIVTLFIVLPIGFLYGIMMMGSATGPEIEASAEGLGHTLGIVIAWLYWTVFESSGWQATPGKRMLGLRVTDAEGNRIGFGRANARYWSKILSALILFIGFLMVAFTRRKQGLHDLIASTLVLRR